MTIRLYSASGINPNAEDLFIEYGDSGSINTQIEKPIGNGISSASSIVSENGSINLKTSTNSVPAPSDPIASGAFSYDFEVSEDLKDAPLEWNFDISGDLNAVAPPSKETPTISIADVNYETFVLSDAGYVSQSGLQQLIVTNGVAETISTGSFENSNNIRAKISPTIEVDSDIDDGIVDDVTENVTNKLLEKKVDLDVSIDDLSAATGTVLSLISGFLPDDFLFLDVGVSIEFYIKQSQQFSLKSVGSGTVSIGLNVGSAMTNIGSASSNWDSSIAIPTITTTSTSYKGNIEDAQVTLEDGSPQPVFYEANGEILTGSEDKDTLVGSKNDDIVRGFDGDDDLSGLSGNDALEGGFGNDSLNGNDGADTLYGNNGNDLMLGGDDNDLLIGGDGLNSIYGEAGDDTLTGGAQRDKLYGGADRDVIEGNAGNDIIKGEAGNDILTGGAGSDTYVQGAGDGRDIISDGGNNEDDKIFFDASIDLENTIFSRSEEDFNELIISFGSLNNSVSVIGQLTDNPLNRIEEFNFNNEVVYTHEDIIGLLD